MEKFGRSIPLVASKIPRRENLPICSTLSRSLGPLACSVSNYFDAPRIEWVILSTTERLDCIADSSSGGPGDAYDPTNQT